MVRHGLIDFWKRLTFEIGILPSVLWPFPLTSRILVSADIYLSKPCHYDSRHYCNDLPL
jgi:hypothetical protein